MTEKNKHYLIRWGLVALGILFTAIGSAMMLKAEIGVGAWDALAQSLNYMTGIKVGTLSYLMNFVCVGAQILIMRSDFKWFNLLQIPVSYLLGTIVNIILYDLLGTVSLDIYLFRLLFLIGGTVIMSFAIGTMIAADLISLPVESLCTSIALKTGKDFGMIRQVFDILTIGVTVLITLLTREAWSIREGTIISTIILGPLMGLTAKKVSNFLKKKGILV